MKGQLSCAVLRGLGGSNTSPATRFVGYEVREYGAMRKSLILSEEPQNSSRLVSKPVTNFCVRSW
jgi:hypothetical protein